MTEPSSSSNVRSARCAGFSLIELLLVMSIIGILAGIAIPNLKGIILEARAGEVSADLNTVRVATANFNADGFTWPAEVGSGVVPPELEEFLPEGFTFQRNGYELDYERLSPIVIPGDPTTTQLIAIAVTADTDELSSAIVKLLGGSLIYSVGRKHTVVIDRS